MTSTDPTAGLPPVPGPAGEPRPPEPPRHDLGRHLLTDVTHLDPADPADTPAHWRLGPPGEPPLELAVVHPAERFREALFGTASYAVLLLLLSVLLSRGDLGVWLLYLAVACIGLVLLYGWFWTVNDAHGWVVAGGNWLAGGRGRRPGRHPAVVCPYTLGKVQLGHGLGIDSEPAKEIVVLRLTQDRPAPAVVHVDVPVLEANPALWALVYNGILHSAARGAVIDDRTREFLHLDPA